MVFQTCHTSRYVLPPSTCHISQLNRCNQDQKCLHLKLAENVCLFVTPNKKSNWRMGTSQTKVSSKLIPKSPCRIKIFGSRSQLLTTNGLILYPTKKCFDQIMMFFYEDWGWKIRVWWKTRVEIELTNGPKNNNCFESKVTSMLVVLLEWKELFTASSVSRDKPIILTYFDLPFSVHLLPNILKVAGLQILCSTWWKGKTMPLGYINIHTPLKVNMETQNYYERSYLF